VNAKLPGYLLVLEDSDEDFDTVLSAARKSALPHEIRRAVNGDECVRLLENYSETDRPLLALLDLNTPLGDGRDTLRTLRQNPKLRTLPVVILSTSGNPKDLDYCYNEGANAYHTKPVDYPEHLDTVCRIFEYWLEGVMLPSSPNL
jgi:CheY-like chemotaxis protein